MTPLNGQCLTDDAVYGTGIKLHCLRAMNSWFVRGNVLKEIQQPWNIVQIE